MNVPLTRSPSLSLSGFLRLGRVHGERGRRRHAPPPGRHQDLRPGQQHQILPGLHQRAVREGPGDPAEGNHPLLPSLTLR